MKIVVVGAGGMLGRDMVAAAEASGHEVRAYGRVSLDITDAEKVAHRFAHDRPDAVINCAAWTDVDGAEDAPEEAMKVNRDGAGIVAAQAAEVGARMVYISTDYVFDGKKGSDYVESDPTGPLSVYGASKLAGESATVGANRRSYVIRTSWLFGLSGSSFVTTMLRLGESQRQVLAVTDQVGSPTFTWHAAHGVIRLLDSDAYGLYHLAGGGHCSRYELTKEAFRLAGIDAVVLSASSDIFDSRAARPAWSGLDTQIRNAIRLPSWQEGLAQFIGQLDADKEVE